MPSQNEHTGDNLVSKPSSDAYRDNYDRIFGKKKPKPETDETDETYPLPSDQSINSTAG